MTRKLTARQRLERIIDGGLARSADILSASVALAVTHDLAIALDDDNDNNADDNAIADRVRATVLDHVQAAISLSLAAVARGTPEDAIGVLQRARRARDDRRARRESAAGLAPPTPAAPDARPDLADALRRAFADLD